MLPGSGEVSHGFRAPVREEIVKPYATEYLSHPDHLRKLVSRGLAKIIREWAAGTTAHNDSVSAARANRACEAVITLSTSRRLRW